MPYFDKEPPKAQDLQLEYQDEVIKQMVKDKMQNVIDKSYIEITDFESMEAMMCMFHCPRDRIFVLCTIARSRV